MSNVVNLNFRRRGTLESLGVLEVATMMDLALTGAVSAFEIEVGDAVEVIIFHETWSDVDEWPHIFVSVYQQGYGSRAGHYYWTGAYPGHFHDEVLRHALNDIFPDGWKCDGVDP